MTSAGTRVPWGVWFEPTQPVTRLVALAGLAESLGAEVCLVADEGTALGPTRRRSHPGSGGC